MSHFHKFTEIQDISSDSKAVSLVNFIIQVIFCQLHLQLLCQDKKRYKCINLKRRKRCIMREMDGIDVEYDIIKIDQHFSAAMAWPNAVMQIYDII